MAGPINRWVPGPCNCECEPGDCLLPEEHCSCAMPTGVDLTLSTPAGDVTMEWIDSPDFVGWWGVLTAEGLQVNFNPSDSIDYMGDDGLGGCDNYGEINILYRMSCPDGIDYPLRWYIAKDIGSNCLVSRGVLRWTGAVGASKPYLGVPWHPTGDYGDPAYAWAEGDETCSCSPLSVEFKVFSDWQYNYGEVATVTLTL